MKSATYKPKLYKFIWTTPFILFYIFVHPPQNELWFYGISGALSAWLLYKLWRDKPDWEKKQENIDYRYSQLEQQCEQWIESFQENGQREQYRRYKRLLSYIKQRKYIEKQRAIGNTTPWLYCHSCEMSFKMMDNHVCPNCNSNSFVTT